MASSTQSAQKNAAGPVVQLRPATENVILVQTPPPPVKSTLESYQTIIVGFLAFLIGILTVSNAIISTVINSRNRKEDETRKRTAFFSVLLADIEQSMQSLQKVSEILTSVDQSSAGSHMWINGVRVASRSNIVSAMNLDWEKLSILTIDEIRSLRKLQNRYAEIAGIFSSILDDPNPTKAQGALPLFDPKTVGSDEDDGGDRQNLLFDDLVDSVNDAILESNVLRESICAKIGE